MLIPMITYKCVYVNISIYIHVYCTYLCLYKYLYIYIYIYRYIHMYMYICICTYVCHIFLTWQHIHVCITSFLMSMDFKTVEFLSFTRKGCCSQEVNKDLAAKGFLGFGSKWGCSVPVGVFKPHAG